MKILAVAQYSGLSGGANRSLLMVLTMLKTKYNHTIHVIVPQDGPLCEALTAENISYDIIHFHEIGGIKKYTIKNALRMLRYRIWAMQDKKQGYRFAKAGGHENYDLVYINDTNNYIGCYIAEALEIPYVWHFRSTIYPETIFLGESRRLYCGANRIIVISECMKDLLFQGKTTSKDRICCIMNGIPFDKPQIISKQDVSSGFHFVECGRITPDKGHKDAIMALACLKRVGINDVYLHIVGEIPDANNVTYISSLKELIKQLDLEDRVVFEGQCNEMSRFREKMNGELICSVCEPFGRVTLEGMRSGLVVIGSNTGGTPEIINDGTTGLLYEQGNAEDLADKIRLIYTDFDLRRALVTNALEFSKTHFTPEQNVAAIERVMCEAVNGRKG